MWAYLEVPGPNGARLVPLEAARFSLGRADTNDIAFEHDVSVSRRHAVLERYPTGWCIRDLGSFNGTWVNGQRVVGAWLEPDDEITLGESRAVFRARSEPEPRTVTAAGPPTLTRREREVLVALCRPMLRGTTFTVPATVSQLADDLRISEHSVKSHLVNLYAKFAIDEEGAAGGVAESRRVQLANEAIRRRAVFLADLREPTARS